MASVKILLRKDKLNSRGECPLFLRIIKNRKSSYIAIGLYIKEKYWDSTTGIVKKSYRNSARLNSFITQKIADARAAIVDVEIKKKPMSSRRLKDKIIGIEPVDFFEFSKGYLDNLHKGDQVGTYRKAKSVVEKLKTYCEEKELYIEDITHTFLQEYENYLKTELKNKPITIHSNMKVIKTIIYDAINDNILSRDDNPFNKYHIKPGTTKRNYLLESELKAIEDYDLGDRPNYKLSRDIFLFACYAGGIRISDLLQLRRSNIAEGKINFKTKKTGNTQVVKLPKKALDILDSYKPEDPEEMPFVFPYFSSEKEIDTPDKLHDMISRKTALINKNLKEIAILAEVNKKISFHVSRHTFATIALKKGIRMEYVSKLLGHANLKETQIYAKIINEELDKAMDVFNE
jgi:integrase/recombinase XerD